MIVLAGLHTWRWAFGRGHSHDRRLFCFRAIHAAAQCAGAHGTAKCAGTRIGFPPEDRLGRSQRSTGFCAGITRCFTRVFGLGRFRVLGRCDSAREPVAADEAALRAVGHVCVAPGADRHPILPEQRAVTRWVVCEMAVRPQSLEAGAAASFTRASRNSRFRTLPCGFRGSGSERNQM